MNSPYSRKRVFTLSTFVASVRDLFTHSDALHAALTRHRVSHAFIEKIMMAVTQVKGCRYCSYAHTHLALKAGVSEAELRQLMAANLISYLRRKSSHWLLPSIVRSERGSMIVLPGSALKRRTGQTRRRKYWCTFV
jgi:AhpD family alkylhydroperoxidase